MTRGLVYVRQASFTSLFLPTPTEQQFRLSKDERKVGTADNKRRVTCA